MKYGTILVQITGELAPESLFIFFIARRVQDSGQGSISHISTKAQSISAYSKASGWVGFGMGVVD